MEKVTPTVKESDETTEAGTEPGFVGTSVYFRVDVLDAVDLEAAKDHRTRSFMVNRLLTEALELRKIRGAA